MKRLVFVLMVFVLSLVMTACSGRKPLVYDGGGCIGYEELVITKKQFMEDPGLREIYMKGGGREIILEEDGQNLTDPGLNAAFRQGLRDEFAKRGLRMCAEGEPYEYRIVVNEVKSDHDRALVPWVTVTDIPAELIIDVAGTFVSKYGVDAYRAGRGIDYQIMNTVTFKQGAGPRVPREEVNYDLRDHFQEPAENYHELLLMYYQALAEEVAEDVADIAK